MTDQSVTVSPADGIDLVATLRSFGVELICRSHANGVRLEGVARSYYGKQMAQELVRKAGVVVVANRIVVERWRAFAAPRDATPPNNGKP